MGSVAAVWDDNHGFLILTVTRTAGEIAAGLQAYQRRSDGRLARIPAYNYGTTAAVYHAVDYLLPLGGAVQYVLAATPKTAPAWVGPIVRIPGVNRAYLRDYFDPALSQKVRVVAANQIVNPARLSWYDVSGQAHRLATYDVRAGRELTLELAVDGENERRNLVELLAAGSPIAFTMCNGLGVDAGAFAVGDVRWERVGKMDRWLVTLPLTEVDPPSVLASHTAADLPLRTYRQQAALAATYDDSSAMWATYAAAMQQ